MAIVEQGEELRIDYEPHLDMWSSGTLNVTVNRTSLDDEGNPVTTSSRVTLNAIQQQRLFHILRDMLQFS